MGLKIKQKRERENKVLKKMVHVVEFELQLPYAKSENKLSYEKVEY